MGTKVTSSSGSVLEEPEIQKLQMQAKIFKENSLNKLNALKSTAQLLENQSIWYQQAFGTTLWDGFQIRSKFDSEVQFERRQSSRTWELIRAMYNRKRQSHEQELKMTLKKLSERQLQIQQCKVQEVQSSVTSSGDETSSRIVSDEEIEKKELEAHYGFMAKIQEVLPAESSSIDTPLEQVQNHDESNVFANERRHSEQPESINDTYVLEKDDSNVIPDSSNICTNDNQVDQNAAECVDERVALANLIANLTHDTEENKTIQKQLKKANASLTQELKECKTNLDETSRALGEGLLKMGGRSTQEEKYKVISDLKVKEGKDIDTMIEMDKQIKFLNEILYKRNQSIQTIHMLAPKCATYNGRSTFANPKYLKKAQSEKPRLYEIPYDTSDPANRFCPDGEETVLLTKVE
ncbi:hypothetical protein Tco_0633742 [Tanacetum coccineum]